MLHSPLLSVVHYASYYWPEWRAQRRPPMSSWPAEGGASGPPVVAWSPPPQHRRSELPHPKRPNDKWDEMVMSSRLLCNNHTRVVWPVNALPHKDACPLYDFILWDALRWRASLSSPLTYTIYTQGFNHRRKDKCYNITSLKTYHNYQSSYQNMNEAASVTYKWIKKKTTSKATSRWVATGLSSRHHFKLQWTILGWAGQWQAVTGKYRYYRVWNAR